MVWGIFWFSIGGGLAVLVSNYRRNRRLEEMAASLVEESRSHFKVGGRLSTLSIASKSLAFARSATAYYIVACVCFLLRDFEEATRHFWHCTAVFVEARSRKKLRLMDEVSEFYCHTYFMWALSDALQNKRVAWENCERNCLFALRNIEEGDLSNGSQHLSAPLVEHGRYDVALMVLRVIAQYQNSNESGRFRTPESTELVELLNIYAPENEATCHLREVLADGALSKAYMQELWDFKFVPEVFGWEWSPYI